MTPARLLRQSLVLVAAGLGVGLAANALGPRPAPIGTPVHAASASATATCAAPEAARPKHRTMSRADAIQACASCTVAFVDARGGAAFAQGHIPEAIHLPPEGHADEPATLERLRGFATVVVYDDTEGCRLGAGVADRLAASGLRDVRLLEGSWSEWLEAQGPAQAGPCESCEAGH